MVVIVLGVVDVLFAVDSVTAKISQYDDMFINFSSSIFAMLTLRSLFFLVMYLSDLFVLMKYGIALILVLVGLQLLLASYIDITNRQSCAIISLVFFTSICASVVYSKCIASCGRRGSVVELEVIGNRHLEPSDVELGDYSHSGPQGCPEVDDASPAVSVVRQRFKRLRIDGEDDEPELSESSGLISGDETHGESLEGVPEHKRRCTDVSSDKSSIGSSCGDRSDQVLSLTKSSAWGWFNLTSSGTADHAGGLVIIHAMTPSGPCTLARSCSSPILLAADVHPTYTAARAEDSRALPTIVPRHLEDKIGAYALAKHWPSMFLPKRDTETPEKFPIPFHPRIGFF
ncbi:hypothetical protein FOZ60_016387 [Perkinsus olseni]|uniref:Transmembrane protein n=1 Tax=Perkinsus olseni TaxID=32597 RepID=A0A7J6P4E7_PEROL|nr:hypothetical protein FOZ60_016387 [Perkinsus olseni]